MYNAQEQGFVTAEQMQRMQHQRMERLSRMGYKGPVGVGPLNENVNGAIHDPRVDQKFGNMLKQRRHIYKEMFGKTSATGDVSDRAKLEKEKGAKPVPGQFAEMERMLDPDRGMSMSMGQGFNSQNVQLDMNTIQGRDFSQDLQRIVSQRQAQQQQAYQQPYHPDMQRQHPEVSQNTLSLDQFIGRPQMSESTPEQTQDYKAYQNYMYQMNEGIIREVAQQEAEKMVKLVLAEHIKEERSKYAFEKVVYESKGEKVELLKKDDKYYRLIPILTDAGKVLALKEVKVKVRSKSKA